MVAGRGLECHIHNHCNKCDSKHRTIPFIIRFLFFYVVMHVIISEFRDISQDACLLKFVTTCQLLTHVMFCSAYFMIFLNSNLEISIIYDCYACTVFLQL